MAPPPYLGSVSSRFPPSDALATGGPGPFPEQDKLTSRRFVLSGSKVASLKARSCSQSVPHPTKVAAVTSLIWQCAMRSYAPSKSNNIPSSSSIWHLVNLRNRIDPPLPYSTFGNLIGSFRASTKEEENADLPSLVSRMTHAKEEYMRDYPKKFDQAAGCDRLLMSVASESINQMAIESADENAETYFFSSVCKQDMYGAADFGWGKPIWATFCINYMKVYKFVVLSDTREDEQGIQVWLNLPKHQMDLFEKDPLFLSFATPNPNILPFDHHHHQTTTPHRLFNGAATPWFNYPSRQLLSRPSDISQLLRPVRGHYSPQYIPIRTIPPPRSIRFISSLLQFHRKLK